MQKVSCMEISLFVCGFNARVVHYCCDQRYVERSLGGTDSAARKSLGRQCTASCLPGLKPTSNLTCYSGQLVPSQFLCRDAWIVDGCLKDPQRNNILSNFSAM